MANMSQRDHDRQRDAYNKLDTLTGPVVVTRDGKDVSPILADTGAAFAWLIRHQNFSVGYALVWGGYAVREASCDQTATHHSDDRVTVHQGHGHALTLCGFHAQPVWLRDLHVRDDVHTDCRTCHPADS